MADPVKTPPAGFDELPVEEQTEIDLAAIFTWHEEQRRLRNTLPSWRHRSHR